MARIAALELLYLFAGSRYRLPSEGGRIIAMSFNPSTFTFLLPCCLFRVATQAARGAQYSPDSQAVNTLSFFFFGGLLHPRLGRALIGTGPGSPRGGLLRRAWTEAAARLENRATPEMRPLPRSSSLRLEFHPGKAVRAHLKDMVRACVKGETTV